MFDGFFCGNFSKLEFLSSFHLLCKKHFRSKMWLIWSTRKTPATAWILGSTIPAPVRMNWRITSPTREAPEPRKAQITFVYQRPASTPNIDRLAFPRFVFCRQMESNPLVKSRWNLPFVSSVSFIVGSFAPNSSGPEKIPRQHCGGQSCTGKSSLHGRGTFHISLVGIVNIKHGQRNGLPRPLGST